MRRDTHDFAMFLGLAIGVGGAIYMGIAAAAVVGFSLATGFGAVVGAALGVAIGAYAGYGLGRVFEKISPRAFDGISADSECIGAGVGMAVGTALGMLAIHQIARPEYVRAETKTEWNISVADNFNARAMKSDKTLVLDAKAFAKYTPKAPVPQPRVA